LFLISLAPLQFFSLCRQISFLPCLRCAKSPLVLGFPLCAATEARAGADTVVSCNLELPFGGKPLLSIVWNYEQGTALLGELASHLNPAFKAILFSYKNVKKMEH